MAFASGHARSSDWRRALDSVLAQLRDAQRGRAPQGPGFVYISDQLGAHASDLLQALKAATGVENWVGSVGVGVVASGIEYMEEPALSVLIADWSAGEYRVFSGKSRAPELSERTASGAQAAHFAVVHGDPDTPDMPELIQDMSAKVGSGFLLGGLSSARNQSFQIANEVVSGGLSGLVVSSAIQVATRLTQGCSPIESSVSDEGASRHVITECERNIIVTIDGRPALDVFREAIGNDAARDLRRAAQTVLFGLPVAGSDTGDYLVRNIVGIDPKNKLLAIGALVEPGMPLLFCRRDGTSAREDLLRMLDRLADQLDSPPRGALYFSCLGRGEHLFGERSAELKLIEERLGPIPLAGFFANGEISHDRLYGYTGVLALFN